MTLSRSRDIFMAKGVLALGKQGIDLSGKEGLVFGMKPIVDVAYDPFPTDEEGRRHGAHICCCDQFVVRIPYDGKRRGCPR